jgi:hypothetical protein
MHFLLIMLSFVNASGFTPEHVHDVPHDRIARYPAVTVLVLCNAVPERFNVQDIVNREGVDQVQAGNNSQNEPCGMNRVRMVPVRVSDH